MPKVIKVVLAIDPAVARDVFTVLFCHHTPQVVAITVIKGPLEQLKETLIMVYYQMFQSGLILFLYNEAHQYVEYLCCDNIIIINCKATKEKCKSHSTLYLYTQDAKNDEKCTTDENNVADGLK